MDVSQFYSMSNSIVELLKARNIYINGAKFTYDIYIEYELEKVENNIISIEVKSADDVIRFLDFLKITHNETEKSLNHRFRVEKGYFIGDKVYLVIGQQS